MTNMTPKDRASSMWAAMHYDIAGCCINNKSAAHAATKAAIIAVEHIKSMMHVGGSSPEFTSTYWQQVKEELETY